MNAAQKWQAVLHRDMNSRDAFLYGVKSTRIFCRPGCASRTPLRANVEFFADAASARAAGYRACKRCEPEGNSLAQRVVVKACELLKAETRPSTAQLATTVGLSPAYFVRLFKKQLGVTPQEYRRRTLSERARESLSSSASVTDSLFAAGYSSSSRFYADAGRELGMTPAQARLGAKGHAVEFVTVPCSLGRVLIAWTSKGVCAVSLGDSSKALEKDLRARFSKATVKKSERSPWLQEILETVDHGTRVDLPLDIRGTAFQQRVWTALRKIPAGQTRSYLQVAHAIGKPKSVRAVARACATNELAVLIPCHRVVRGDGSLAGYRWGLERKRQLLTREKVK